MSAHSIFTPTHHCPRCQHDLTDQIERKATSPASWINGPPKNLPRGLEVIGVCPRCGAYSSHKWRKPA